MKRAITAFSFLFVLTTLALSAGSPAPPPSLTCDQVWDEARQAELEAKGRWEPIWWPEQPENVKKIAAACAKTIRTAPTINDLLDHRLLEYVEPLERLYYNRAAQLVRTPNELAHFKFARTDQPSGAKLWQTWKRVCKEVVDGKGVLSQDDVYSAGNQCSQHWMVMKSPKGESDDFARYDELLRTRSINPFNLGGWFVAAVVIEPKKDEKK